MVGKFGSGQVRVNSSLHTGQLEGSRGRPGQPPVSTTSGLSPPLLIAPGSASSSSIDQIHIQAYNQISQVRGAAGYLQAPPR